MRADGFSEPIEINLQGKEKTFVFEDICLQWHQSCMNLKENPKEDFHMPEFPKSEFDGTRWEVKEETKLLIPHYLPGPQASACLPGGCNY